MLRVKSSRNNIVEVKLVRRDRFSCLVEYRGTIYEVGSEDIKYIGDQVFVNKNNLLFISI